MSTPELTISTTDFDRLETLLDNLPADALGADTLSKELDRANIVEPKDLPDNIVSMNSTVRFSWGDGKSSSLTLVYPKDMDKSGTTISVLAPVGSALLGLKTGDTINWPLPNGDMSTITIDEVLYQPEREGIFHR
ncbi:nucleoside diphosphate kinase regulator [Rheinheimera sp. MMS21-TC3]|uniref:nucleoside diphosphate kinase regulator n=1 Tax=Rheinheimera sp. MMS21-TC3 TaxID=3072790 RepID=UPI0028C3DEA9|nr:nucleoside diphosphate kinase regulator [Rheinheimera sp. MMS21-TC3]WNO61310.1 nucleoside diphosphate kinase regulator [Rheinheimera sp. MMS21-TC3]